jgi:hypothetical protein
MKPFTAAASTLFALFAVVHLLRFLGSWEVRVTVEIAIEETADTMREPRRMH